ncbi:hypothetical protein PDESU_04951 [Pontiella desulfatans]|uniref:Fibronectin type-III domain-containing protein n=1 Tax=Pontiella desulfatans TaxID=2750659 RepID=A0A6C2U8H6_PONDE|nr:right-handed parallel beta-helix repeat-containing protein [Pontiella desulfatans]VGO16360.1 hypothetical protein PDESU_04951 [Pontiella desulfatans]
MRKLIFILCCVSAGWIQAADVYVATNGVDAGSSSSIGAPFATVSYAASKMSAGDTCYIRGGSYHDEVILSGENNLTFKAYPGEQVTMDGTVAITTPWTLHSGSIYKTTLSQDIWQLFAGEEMMMPARWPNAFLHDDSVWDLNNHWARIDHNLNTTTTMVDDPTGHSDLAALPFSITNAIAVLNVGSFKTYARLVNTHAVGSDTFAVNAVGSLKSSLQYYFLEGKLEFLDVEKEWYFNKDTDELYFWGNTNATIRGKVQDYAFQFTNCDDITISGIDFFATTVYFSGCHRVWVEKGDYNFPSCTKRMLGAHSVSPNATAFIGGSDNAFYDNTMRFAETQAIYMDNGTDNLIENCLFEYIDWSVADLPSLMGTVYMRGSGSVYRGNTAHTTGASEFFDVNDNPVAELNLIYNIGLVQNDGAAIQLTVGAQPETVVAYNWFFESDKYGARFDASTALGSPTGMDGLMHHNVGFHVKSTIMQKGDYHECYNNTSLNTENNGIIILADNVSDSLGTIVQNNAAERLGSSRSGNDPLAPVTIHDHNWNGYEYGNADARTVLRDPDNLDFRPIPNSILVDGGTPVSGITDAYTGRAPDIGAYEHGAATYWIAGRQEKGASTAIPPDGSTTVKASASLMWLKGLESTSSDVYLGTASNAVATASTNSSEFVGNQLNNIYDPLGLFAQTYFWRVDEHTPSGIVTGAVWTFTVPSATLAAPGIVNLPAQDITGTSATLGGQITDGGTSSKVWIYWWPDGGATNEVYIGKNAGYYGLPVSGLQSNATYNYYAYAENRYGSNTTASVEIFTTGDVEPPEPEGPQAMYFTELAAVPSTGVEVSWTTLNSTWNNITVAANDGSGDEQLYGQTFSSTTDFNLSAISFHATADTRTYGTNQVLELALLEDTDTNGVPDTILGAVYSVQFPSIDGSKPWKKMSFANAIPLKGDTAYGFVYTLIGPVSNDLRVSTDKNDGYSDGNAVKGVYPAGAFPGSLPPTLNNLRDLAFVIQGDAEGDTLYGDWLGEYTAGGQTALEDNPDLDTLNNLQEYAFGGGPDNPNDPADIFPAYSITNSADFEFIYRRRKDAEARGLSYWVEAGTNLLSDTWTTNGVQETGVGAVDADFESVTNLLDASLQNESFIRLRVRKN